MTIKKCKKCNTEKLRTEFYKASKELDGLMYTCKDCYKIVDRKRRLKHADKEKSRHAKYSKENPEKEREKYRRWYKNNSEKASAKAKRYYLKNLDKNAAKSSKRRAQMANACVSWADTDKIQAIYSKCRQISDETGIEHHVDHIIPIKSDFVCGLHVENNLRILTGFENQSKHNNFEPG